MGGALAYNNTKSTFDQNLGDVKAQTYSLGLYGTYYVGNWYLDGFLSYGYVAYDTERVINIPSNSVVHEPSTRPRRQVPTEISGRQRSEEATIITGGPPDSPRSHG